MEIQISLTELKKIDVEFRRRASRLLRTQYGNELRDLSRFMNYIDNEPFIKEFIDRNNQEEFDIKYIIDNTEWRELYDIPIEVDREIAWVYQFLKYCQQTNLDLWRIAGSYASGKHIQDMIDGFCQQVINPFVNHILAYFEEVMIEMGHDDNAKVKIEIKSGNGQVNVATDYSTINAVNNVNMATNDIKSIIELTEKIMEMLKNDNTIDTAIKDTLVDDIEIIKEQIESDTPKPTRIKKALASIGGVQGALKHGTSIMMLLNSLTTQLDTFIEGLKVLG